ncbi:MAG TPA: pitrilysin family protein [Thermoanaerobaculia bacterium]
MAAGRPPVDRSAPPPPAEAHPFRFPHFLRARLPNGLSVAVARLAGLPLVSLELIAPAGAQYDSVESSGTATLTAGLLDEGTARRSSLEIANTAERLGGYLITGADWDVGYLSTSLLASHRREGLDLLAEIVTAPTFPDNEVERLRRLRISEILRRRQDPSALADDRFQREIYRGSIYAEPLYGTEDSVARLERAAMIGFYQSHYGFAGSTLIAVGDFDSEDLLREAEAAFGAAGPPGPAPARPEIRPLPLEGLRIHLVDRPGAAQTELRVGHVGGVPRTHPDHIPLLVLNTLLGGKFTSRINLNLRERHGYTYGAASRFSSRQGPGPFTIQAAVETAATAASAREILHEMRRVRESLVEPEELAETAGYIIGVFPYSLQTVGDITRRLETLSVFGLPDDYYDHYLERIATVTREDLREVARRHLDPERIAVVAVGPAETLEPQFERMGPVTVWSPEGEPRAAQPVRAS